MVVLAVKLVALTLSVTWGLTKTILFGVGLPVILAVLFIAGLTAFAVPLLILALLGVFLLPLFGICLGHQIMGLAVGAKTLKMKFGHHGANHPVENVETKRVYITSQNHGFAVDADTLPANARATHHSLFDGSLQGFELIGQPAFCFQGHPEASPGPHDIDVLFEKFAKSLAGRRAG